MEDRIFSSSESNKLKEVIIPENIQKIVSSYFGFQVNKNITLKFIGSERTIEGLDGNNYKEIVWNYTGE